jgi:hypothetical protein
MTAVLPPGPVPIGGLLRQDPSGLLWVSRETIVRMPATAPSTSTTPIDPCAPFNAYFKVLNPKDAGDIREYIDIFDLTRREMVARGQFDGPLHFIPGSDLAYAARYDLSDTTVHVVVSRFEVKRR